MTHSKPLCPGHSRRDGRPCGMRKGWGTDHVGYGLCRKHGGNTPGGRKQAYTEMAMEELENVRATVVMGIAIDIDPMDALLACVRIAAGEVAYCTWRVGQLAEDDAVGNERSTKERPLSLGKDGEDNAQRVEEVTVGDPALHIWIRVRQNALDRLAKFSKMALDAGVAERSVRIAEDAGDSLALGLRRVLDGLNLTAAQEAMAPDLIRAMLETLEQSSAGEIVA